MRVSLSRTLGGVLLSFLLTVSAAAAQTGTVVGSVVDAQTGTPIADVSVSAITGTSTVGGALSDAQGRFRLQLPVGTYSLAAEIIGYTDERIDGVNVLAGQTAEVTLEMTSTAVEMAGFEVIIRGGEKASTIANVNSVSVLSGPRLEERTALSPVEQVRGVPGVDISQTGLSQANVVTRGFNNVFSGALLVLTDNRYAAVPSLRFNAYNMVPANQFDVERIEVLRGPAAALYGPNSANGVLHLITASPIDDPSSKVAVSAGERNVFLGQFRSAYRFSESAGIKVSGQYFQGTDWRYDDPAEVAARAADPTLQPRDFDLQRFGGEVRFDWRPDDESELIVNAGANQLGNSIEMTGIGTGQADDWLYSYLQARYQRNRFFAQAFWNQTNSGDTFLFQTGLPIRDESRMFVGQVQQGFSLGERLDIITGFDAQRTDARTNGTINGRNEDDDTIDELGAFLHAEAELSDNLTFMAAIRGDDHSRLPDPVWSPRAALLFEPAPNQAFRLSYNRAFATPTSLNLFLDIQAGRIPVGPAGYDIFTRGVPQDGFTFDEVCTGGLNGNCMVSPFAPDPTARIAANAAPFFDPLFGVVLSGAGLDAGTIAQLQALFGTPGALPGDASIGSLYRTFDQQAQGFPVDPNGPNAIAPLEPTIYNNFEVGYKGLVSDKLLLSVDIYSQQIKDFIGPLRVETPNIFFDPATLQAYFGGRLNAAVTGGQITPAQAQAIQAQLPAIVTGLASIPVGTVAPDGENSSDILLSYRNFGDVDLWGADLALQYMPNANWTITGTYSFVSDDCFNGGGGEITPGCVGLEDVALNAPRHKGSLGVRYEDRSSGWAWETRARGTDAFPMNSGVFQGEVASYYVMDASVSYRLPWARGATIGLSASNLFHLGRGFDGEEILDGRHQEFVGAPFLGRLLLAKVQYEF